MSNRPLIVGLLFLGTYFAPFLILIGLPLAYVFRQRPEEDWEQSHFQFLIRTFWLALLFLLMAVAVGFGIALLIEQLDALSALEDGVNALGWLYLLAAAGITLAYSGVRVVVSLMKSAIRSPISNPKAWLI
jgi:uncharacterized membrane protein